MTFDEFDQWVAVACYKVRQLLAADPMSSIAGARVALMAHASADSLALSLAVPTLSAVLVQLNWRQPEATLTTMLSGLGCSLLVAGRSFADKARRLRAQSGVPMLALVDDASVDEPPTVGLMSFDCDVCCDPARLRAESPAVAAAVAAAAAVATCEPGSQEQRPEPSDVAAVMFTSGTSALPKPVPLTHRGLLWSCRAKRSAERAVLGIDDTEHRGTLAFLPAFHVIGFTNNFLYNLLCGVRCMVHVDAARVPVTSGLLLRACDELRPSILDTVPALLQAVTSGGGGGGSSGTGNNGVNGASGSSISPSDAAILRNCAAVLYGGAPLVPGTARALRQCGVSVYSQYGQTEVHTPASQTCPRVSGRQPCSCPLLCSHRP